MSFAVVDSAKCTGQHRAVTSGPGALAWTAFGVVALLSLPSAAAASWFRGLGVGPGNPPPEVWPNDISADGTVIVGSLHFDTYNDEAFRWTMQTGFIGLGNLGGVQPVSAAAGVSADGAVVVGVSQSPESGKWYEPMMWTEVGGMVGMGDLPGGLFDGVAFAASADGSVIVGRSSSVAAPNSFGEAFRWTAETGMVGLGVSEPSDFHATLAFGVSYDGSVIVGTIRTLDGNEAFRWTEPEGMVILGDLPDIQFPSVWPADVSADGSVVVGTSQPFAHPRCFRWTSQTGMVEPALIPGAWHCSVLGVSADGSVIVGRYELGNEQFAFLWDESHGLRDLGEAMVEADLGPVIEGWDFEAAVAVAADNETIVGWGYNPAGEREAFLVNLGPPSVLEVPALSPGALATFAALMVWAALVGLRRRPPVLETVRRRGATRGSRASGSDSP